MICRVCEKSKLEGFYTLKDYPFVAGPVCVDKVHIAQYDLNLGFCSNCGACSLLNPEVDGLVYGDSYTSSNITYGKSRSMDDMTDRFLAFVGKSGKGVGSKVLEIGCYDGAFMDLMAERYSYEVIGCESCHSMAACAQDRGHDVRAKGFERGDYRDLDMVVARNVLEHIAQPQPFVEGIASVLNRGGSFVLEIPAGEDCIGMGILGTIVPEHPCYYSKESLKRLLRQYFSRLWVYQEGIMLRAIADSPRSSFINSGRRNSNTKPLMEWLKIGGYARGARYRRIRDTVGKNAVGLFGANTCALELLSSGTIKASQVKGIYDDDPRKWGKYLVNTDLMVLPREQVGKDGCKGVVVCSYAHRNSITEYLSGQGLNPILLYSEVE